MAVEIPVVIDVEGAFKEAASKVKTSIKPLQEQMDQNALAIQLKIDEKTKLAVKDILDDATLSAKQLKFALEDLDAKIRQRSSSGGFDLSKGLVESEKIMLQAAGALENKIYGIQDSSAIMSRILTANIDKAKAKYAELGAELDALTKKQNFNVKKISETQFAPKGTGKTYEKTKAQIESVNAELASTKNLLATLEMELNNIGRAGNYAATSVSKIKTPAMQMADEWRRGAAYVEQWNKSLGVANSRLISLIKGSATLIALHSAGTFVRNVRNVTAEFEMQRVALGGIIQDTEKAEELFSRIKAAAIKSPFEIKDLVTFTKQLSAYRIETENLFDVTMKLADVSAGLGVDMNRLVLAYGQVRAASVLRGQELRQFTEAGIPLVEKLAQKFEELGRKGTTTADVFELISKRAVPFRMIEEIFDDMTSAGGEFYKMQEKQSETLKGQWMKLKDALSIMYDEIGNTGPVHRAMESLLKTSMNMLQNWREVGRTIGIATASLVAYKVAALNARIAENALSLRQAASISALQLNITKRSQLIAGLFGEAAATKAAIFVGNQYVRMKKREMVATNMFTKAYYKMLAAFWANPYAVALAGITALIVVIDKLIRKSKEAKYSTEEFQKSIDSLKSANDHAREIEDLCDAYDKLVQKTDRTREEQEKLNRVSKELAKIYPSAVSGVDAFGDAIEINTKKVREMSNEERELLALVIERKKAQAESSMQSLADRRKEINDILKAGGYMVGGTEEVPETFHALTPKDREKLGNELSEIIKNSTEAKKAISEAEEALLGFVDEAAGPPPPEFLGDAWRLRISNYTTMLEGSKEKVSAFIPDQVRQFNSIKDALEEVGKLYQEQVDLVEFYTKALETATGAQAVQFATAKLDAESLRNMYSQMLTDYNAWNLVQEKTRAAAEKDPFITQMENRIKFMQDFKKGYDELRRYLASTQALSEEAGFMLGRGTSLGLDAAEQTRAATELSEWYQEMIEKVQAQMKAKGAKGVTVTDLLGLQIPEAKKQLKDLQALLQTLWDAKTDYDTRQKAQELEDALKKVALAVKESETARNFYQDILDLTGDSDLAATMTVSVYGGIGEDFKTRMQQQLNAALESLDPSQVTDDLRAAFRDMDYKTILKNIDLFGEKWQEQLRQMAEDQQKFSADQIKTWLDELKKAKTYGEQRVEIAQKTAQKIAEINASSLPEDQKMNLSAQYARKEAEEVAKLQYDVFKESPMYVDLFENLDQASSKMLENMRNSLIALKDHWKDLRPTEVKELQSRIEELDHQLASRNPFKTLVNSWREYKELRQQGRTREEDESNAVAANENRIVQQQILEKRLENLKVMGEMYGVDSEQYKLAKSMADEQKKITDLAIEEADAAERSAHEHKDIADQIQKAVDAAQEYAGYLNEAIDAASKIVSTFASDDTTEYFDTLVEGIGQTISGTVTMAGSLAKIVAGAGTAQDYVNIIKGTADIIQGIFGTKKKLEIQSLNKEIENQEVKINSLDKAVEHLSDSMNKAFGSDYVHAYTQQLDAMLAKQKAYEEQARLEREKGKKADEEKIRGYEESAADVANEILNMQGQLSEFFAGTDIQSAARDFADAWIDAYKEFGSTTDAMKQKFNDMIQNMVTSAVGAKIMETILRPLYEQIDQMAVDGDLSAEEIAKIGQEAPKYIEQMNLGMSNLMTSLAAAGYNVRQQVGSMSGISKQIAGASEESILGLAAGINTQNFYMSYMPGISENVASILAVISPGTQQAQSGPSYSQAAPGMLSVQELVNKHMPNMDYNLSEVVQMLRNVIKPNGTPASFYVSAKM